MSDKIIDVREHKTERINRARLKLELSRASRPLIVVVIGGVIGLAAWLVQVKEVGQYVLKSSRTVRFAVNDASGVVAKRQEVRFKGVPAGTITGVHMDHGQAVLTVKIYKEFGPIYRDARATLRPNTALEDMYLDILNRGTKAAGQASESTPIPARQTDTSVQAEDVLQVFDPNTRTHMAALLRDLGGGLKDRGGALQEAFVKTVPFLRIAARMTDQLGVRSRETRRLVHNFSILTGELARRDRDLRVLSSEGGATLKTLGGASPQLDATLRELPPTLSTLDTSFTAVRGVLPTLNEALRSLNPVADRLPTGLSSLRSLSASADPAVRALREPVHRLVPFADSLKPFSSNLDRALAGMRPDTGAIAHFSKSLAKCVYPGLYGFFQWDASLAKYEDAYGVYPRGDGVVGVGTNPIAKDGDLAPQIGCAPGMPKGGTP